MVSQKHLRIEHGFICGTVVVGQAALRIQTTEAEE